MRSPCFPASVALIAAFLMGCATDEIPAEGVMTAQALAERDPFDALSSGVRRLVAMPPFASNTEDLARRLAALLAREEFDTYPIARGRIRPLLFHIAHPPANGSRENASQALLMELETLPRRQAATNTR